MLHDHRILSGFVLSIFFTVALTACSDEVTGTFDREAYCAHWCDGMTECGLIGYDRTDCIEACDSIFEDSYLESCADCLEANDCSDVDADCFDDDGPCHVEPSTSYLVNMGGFAEDYEGVRAYGKILTYDGRQVGTLRESDIENNRLGLEFGIVLRSGFHYVLQLYLDVEDNAVCDPEIDPTYEDEIIIDEPLAVVYSIASVPEETTDGVCANFPSRADLCDQYCNDLHQCNALQADVADCTTQCEAELSPSFLSPCVSCLEDFDCASYGEACLQSGGYCDVDRVPPETEFLFSGSGFVDDYEGLTMHVVVTDLAGQQLTPMLEDTIDENGVFLNFGQTLWMNQTFRVLFFIDLDDTGQCNESDPGWELEVEIEDSILHYELHEHDPGAVTDICSQLPE